MEMYQSELCQPHIRDILFFCELSSSLSVLALLGFTNCNVSDLPASGHDKQLKGYLKVTQAFVTLQNVYRNKLIHCLCIALTKDNKT